MAVYLIKVAGFRSRLPIVDCVTTNKPKIGKEARNSWALNPI